MTAELLLADFATEKHVMAELLTNPERFSCLDTLEYLDFQEFRLRTIFVAIRRLQANEFTVTTTSVLDEIWRDDDDNGTKKADFCIPLAVEILLTEASYPSDGLLIEHDVWWLKKLAQRRRELDEKAAA